MPRLAIFGSGNGTNAQRLCEYFSHHEKIEVACIVYNRKDAFIAQRAQRLGVESRYFGKKDFADCDEVLRYLHDKRVDYVILAGFLLLVPERLVEAFPDRIVNIHPALLPKYGGKGMFGEHVHQAVVANRETETGITVHVVDTLFDHGSTILQAHCPVTATDTADDVAAKIHVLEQTFFPVAVEHYVLTNARG